MKIFYTCSLIVCSYFAQAQKIHSTIPVKDIGNASGQLEIQGLQLNDSILITGYSTKHEPTKAFWILPSGKSVKLDNPGLNNKLIVGLATSGDSTYIYYLEQFKNYVLLRAVVQNRQTGIVNNPDKGIVVNGSFVSVFHSGKHHYLLSISRKQNQIYLAELKGLQRLSGFFITSPFDLNTNSSAFSFVSEKEILSPLAAASPNKIYQQGDFIYVGIDETKTASGTPAKTSILKVNLNTGESETRIMVDNSGKEFSTYIERDHIFKITKSRSLGAIITIYNLHDFSVNQTMKISEDHPMAENRSFKKDFTKTTDKESIWDAVSNNGAGFIMATSTDSGNFVIRIGSHHLISRSAAGFIPVFSAFPVLAIVGAVARVAALSLSEMESVDRYLYLTWDGKNEPLFADKPVSAMQSVDEYDVALFKQKTGFKYKGYLQDDSKIFGIYQEAGSASVDIILFRTP